MSSCATGITPFPVAARWAVSSHVTLGSSARISKTSLAEFLLKSCAGERRIRFHTATEMKSKLGAVRP